MKHQETVNKIIDVINEEALTQNDIKEVFRYIIHMTDTKLSYTAIKLDQVSESNHGLF